jgi:hypothetical protein
MPGFAANYRITLRTGLSAREAALFSALGAQVTGATAGKSDAPLYQLTCTEVNFKDSYLEVTVFREPEDWLLPLYIPHELVLLVSGKADSFPAGFGP